jgi:hypothetical protein
MLASLLVALAVLTVQSRFDDPDMWWHLKMGEIIWTTHNIPTTDIFSYTTGHHPYTAHEWLSQVFIYGAYKFGGYAGLMFWLCLFTSALLVAGYGLCWLYSENAKVAFVGTVIIFLFATIGLAVRPQMIGYFLLVVELLLIQLGRIRNPRWLLGLPPLFAIWVNCHGSFFLGLLVAGTYFFSSFFDFQKGLLVSHRSDSRTRLMFALTIAMSIAALFINPIGIKQILYPLDAILHLPINLNQVDEWRPLQLTDGRGLTFLAVLGCIFLFLILRQSKLFLHELLLISLVIWLAASHRRMLFPFGILAAPILSRFLSGSWDRYNAMQDRPWPNALLMSASLLIAFRAFPNGQDLARQVEQQSPVKAVEFMKASHLSGRMLNEYVFGGYLIWAAPQFPVFVDGRGDVFEQTGVLGEFEQWATLQTEPRILLDKYQIDFCLLSRSSPMLFVLRLLPDWKATYSDNNSIIFMRVPKIGSAHSN